MAKEFGVILIGCGRYAEQSHLKALAAFQDNVKVIAVVDLDGQQQTVQGRFENLHFKNCNFEFVSIPTEWEYELPDQTKIESKLDRLLQQSEGKPPIQAVIISTYNLTHKGYVEWALKKRLSVLVDKPLTVARHCGTNEEAATGIWKDYEELVGIHGEQLQQNANLLFMLATQRRYQQAYRDIAKHLQSTYGRTKCPVTFVQCLSNDGYWLGRKGYEEARSYNPERSGGGKLVHTGYHLIDIVPWLLRHHDTEITQAVVYANTFRPHESWKLHNVDGADKEELNLDLGEINVAVQIAFQDRDNHTRCLAQFGMLHEGLSVRPFPQPSDTIEQEIQTAVNGRTKQEFMTLYQGPFSGIWYRRIAKLSNKNSPTVTGNLLGGKGHLELIYADNPCFVNSKEGTAIPSINVGEYQEEDDAPAKEFLESLLTGKTNADVVSPVSDHAVGIKFLSTILKSCASGKCELVNFNEDWTQPPPK